MTLLPDIERGPTWSTDHRHECLLRWVASLTSHDRTAFMTDYQSHHGRPAALTLYSQAKALGQSSFGKNGQAFANSAAASNDSPQRAARYAT